MFKKLLVAAAVGLPLAASATFAAADRGDESDRHAGDRVVGVVTAEAAQTLTIETRHGDSVDVHWTPLTECRLDGEDVSCDAIDLGHYMLARGTSAGQSGQFHADRIRAVSDVNRDRVEKVRGVVTAASGQTLVVENRVGESVVVTWTDDTYCEGHDGQIRCDTIAVGDHVGAIGPADDDPAGFTARAIKKASDRRHLERMTGIVSSNHGHVMEVLTRDGTVNVHWDADTKCHGLDGRIACDTIEPRSVIAAGGEELSERNFDAAVIKVLPVRDRLTDEVRDRLSDEARDRLSDEVRDRIRDLDIDEDELRDRLEDAVRDRLGDDALDRDEIRDRIEDAIRDRLLDDSQDDDDADDGDHDDDDSDDDEHDGEDHD